MQLPEIVLAGVAVDPPLKKVNTHIFVPLACGVPQDGGFDCLDLAGRDGIDLIFTLQDFARKESPLGVQYLQTD